MRESLQWQTPLFASEQARQSLTTMAITAFESATPDFIVVDDCSGRLPGLVVSSLLRAKVRDAAETAPVVRFFHGRGWRDRGIVANALKPADPAEEVLLVTDYINLGNATRRIMELLRSAEVVSFDTRVVVTAIGRSSPSIISSVMHEHDNCTVNVADPSSFINAHGWYIQHNSKRGVIGYHEQRDSLLAGRHTPFPEAAVLARQDCATLAADIYGVLIKCDPDLLRPSFAADIAAIESDQEDFAQRVRSFTA